MIPSRPSMAATVDEFAQGEGCRSVYFRSLSGTTKELQSKGSLVMPGASLLKPLLVDTLLALTTETDLYTERVQVADLEATMYPSIISGLSRTRRLTLSELCAFTIITSDNSCANYLLKLVGPHDVNERARRLGLQKTYLRVGFDDAHLGREGRVNVTTAEDMGVFFSYLWEHRSDERESLWRWLTNNLRNNRLPARLPDDVPVAHKTGSLPAVVNDAGVICGSKPFVLCVLMDQQENSRRSADEMSRLAAWIYETEGIDA